VALPIGISFFTFQAMSYVIDVYRKKGKVQYNPLQVGLYVSLFPQLIAGPIVRYETVAEQIEHRVENFKDFSAGITRFCIGLGKKVLIANNMAVVADAAFDLIINNEFQASVGMAWLGAIAYTLQIFFDFSGYSDMAIGLGQMFGFHFEENFNYPYISKTVTEFWRRWHISMQTWFRDYVYIPLGGSRVSKPRLIFNIFVVWLCTGIWHGANWTFIAWGLMYFVILTFERLTGLSKKEYWWGHIYTMVLVIIGWVIFRSTGLGTAFLYIKAMFGIGAKGICDKAVWAYIAQNWIYFVFALIGCAPLVPAIDRKLKDNKVWNMVYVVTVVAIMVVSVSFISNNAYNPFIYFNF
jgi:alginate O-acetyltransferase complex protein AlgI